MSIEKNPPPLAPAACWLVSFGVVSGGRAAEGGLSLDLTCWNEIYGLCVLPYRAARDEDGGTSDSSFTSAKAF